ncbi:MAG: hypothetical protein Q9217_003420 [Psora testacea]
MFLSCGHHFDVAFLDRTFGLMKAYDLSSTGQIRGISHTTLNEACGMNPQCPTCGGSCKNVRRYSIFDQLANMAYSIDHAQSNFARRIYKFLEKIKQIRGELYSTFDRFTQGLRPGPLAARQNEAIILERVNALGDVETAICRLKDELVRPFEDAVTSLVGFLGNSEVLQDLKFPSALRLDSLYYRCRLTILEEHTRSLLPLREMAKQSQHSEVLAEGIRRVSVPKIAGQLNGIKASILETQNKRLPRLEVELRLVQLASKVALDNIGARNMLAGASTELKQIEELCQRFPLTAGLLMSSCQKIRPFLLRTEAKGHPLYSKLTQEAWWTWPKHHTGKLIQCENRHLYSGILSSHCPECGPEAEIDKLKEIKPNASLRAGDFVAAMKAHRFDGASYRSRRG